LQRDRPTEILSLSFRGRAGRSFSSTNGCTGVLAKIQVCGWARNIACREIGAAARPRSEVFECVRPARSELGHPQTGQARAGTGGPGAVPFLGVTKLCLFPRGGGGATDSRVRARQHVGARVHSSLDGVRRKLFSCVFFFFFFFFFPGQVDSVLSALCIVPIHKGLAGPRLRSGVRPPGLCGRLIVTKLTQETRTGRKRPCFSPGLVLGHPSDTTPNNPRNWTGGRILAEDRRRPRSGRTLAGYEVRETGGRAR